MRPGARSYVDNGAERRSISSRDGSPLPIGNINNVAIRRGFIQKVYGILTCQLILTTALATLTIMYFEDFRRKYPIMVIAVQFIALFGHIAITCTMVCNPKSMRRAPTNYTMLFLITVCDGVLVGCICMEYTLDSVIIVAAMTTFLVVFLTIFSFQTSMDFTGFAPYLFAAAMCLSMFCLSLCIASLAGLDGTDFETLNLLYCCLGATLACFFFIFDTQMIIGGKHQMRFSIDDYCLAAMFLYADTIQLFLYLLRIFGERDN